MCVSQPLSRNSTLHVRSSFVLSPAVCRKATYQQGFRRQFRCPAPHTFDGQQIASGPEAASSANCHDQTPCSCVLVSGEVLTVPIFRNLGRQGTLVKFFVDAPRYPNAKKRDPLLVQCWDSQGEAFVKAQDIQQGYEILVQGHLCNAPAIRDKATGRTVRRTYASATELEILTSLSGTAGHAPSGPHQSSKNRVTATGKVVCYDDVLGRGKKQFEVVLDIGSGDWVNVYFFAPTHAYYLAKQLRRGMLVKVTGCLRSDMLDRQLPFAARQGMVSSETYVSGVELEVLGTGPSEETPELTTAEAIMQRYGASLMEAEAFLKTVGCGEGAAAEMQPPLWETAQQGQRMVGYSCEVDGGQYVPIYEAAEQAPPSLPFPRVPDTVARSLLESVGLSTFDPASTAVYLVDRSSLPHLTYRPPPLTQHVEQYSYPCFPDITEQSSVFILATQPPRLLFVYAKSGLLGTEAEVADLAGRYSALSEGRGFTEVERSPNKAFAFVPAQIFMAGWRVERSTGQFGRYSNESRNRFHREAVDDLASTLAERLDRTLPRQMAEIRAAGVPEATLGGSPFTSLSFSEQYCNPIHLDSNDVGEGLILWLLAGKGKLVGGEFNVPSLKLRFLPGPGALTFFDTSLLHHGTSPVDLVRSQGTIRRIGSALYVTQGSVAKAAASKGPFAEDSALQVETVAKTAISKGPLAEDSTHKLGTAISHDGSAAGMGTVIRHAGSAADMGTAVRHAGVAADMQAAISYGRSAADMGAAIRHAGSAADMGTGVRHAGLAADMGAAISHAGSAADMGAAISHAESAADMGAAIGHAGSAADMGRTISKATNVTQGPDAKAAASSSPSAEDSALQVETVASHALQSITPMQRSIDPMQGSIDPMQRSTGPMQRSTGLMQRSTGPMQGSIHPMQGSTDPMHVSTGPMQGSAIGSAPYTNPRYVPKGAVGNGPVAVDSVTQLQGSSPQVGGTLAGVPVLDQLLQRKPGSVPKVGESASPSNTTTDDQKRHAYMDSNGASNGSAPGHAATSHSQPVTIKARSLYGGASTTSGTAAILARWANGNHTGSTATKDGRSGSGGPSTSRTGDSPAPHRPPSWTTTQHTSCSTTLVGSNPSGGPSTSRPGDSPAHPRPPSRTTTKPTSSSGSNPSGGPSTSRTGDCPAPHRAPLRTTTKHTGSLTTNPSGGPSTSRTDDSPAPLRPPSWTTTKQTSSSTTVAASHPSGGSSSSGNDAILERWTKRTASSATRAARGSSEDAPTSEQGLGFATTGHDERLGTNEQSGPERPISSTAAGSSSSAAGQMQLTRHGASQQHGNGSHATAVTATEGSGAAAQDPVCVGRERVVPPSTPPSRVGALRRRVPHLQGLL